MGGLLKEVSVTNEVLVSDSEFLTAALVQSNVSVWYREDPDPIGNLMDYGGIVEGYTPDSIKLAGAHFVRGRFEFRTYIK
ncbi:hypothetical protein NSQ29_10655 [Paenibacillus sp. FSL F4-0236]|uniref:hypothetical protein n=1 Tax=Paenibacillus sp. FSL F4-0236 TaxID=2954731 RepID=UPI0030F95B5D